MDEKAQQELIDKTLTGELAVSDLDEARFYHLLDGLRRMYIARIWNCIDPHGTMDKEWSALSSIFGRICREWESGASNTNENVVRSDENQVKT